MKSKNAYRNVIKFGNGYSASIISNCNSVGGDEGLFEIAVIGKDGLLDYSTPLTSDVIGSLTFSEVGEILSQIENLPSITPAFELN